MALDVQTLLFIMAAGFVGSFVDATVGGGGLVTTPALLATGMPVAYAFGTNKLASAMGASTSVFTFLQAGKINLPLVKKLVPFSFLGSALGAYVVYLLPEHLMKNIVVICLVVVAVYTYRRKDWGDVSNLRAMTKTVALLTGLMAFGLGFYDGFFGPGTGSFLIFGFLSLGYDFLSAAGNAKILNLSSGLGAFLTFAFAGTVYWGYALGMGLAMIAGARVGAKVALAKGADYVKPLYLVVTTLLIGKQVYEIFFK